MLPLNTIGVSWLFNNNNLWFKIVKNSYSLDLTCGGLKIIHLWINQYWKTKLIYYNWRMRFKNPVRIPSILRWIKIPSTTCVYYTTWNLCLLILLSVFDSLSFPLQMQISYLWVYRFKIRLPLIKYKINYFKRIIDNFFINNIIIFHLCLQYIWQYFIRVIVKSI